MNWKELTGPGGLLRPCAVTAFHHRGVIRFEIKGGTKYEFKFGIYNSGEMKYSGKVSSSLRGPGVGREEEREAICSQRRPRLAQSWPTCPQALGQRRGQRGALGAAGKEEEGQYNRSPTLNSEGLPSAGLP